MTVLTCIEHCCKHMHRDSSARIPYICVKKNLKKKGKNLPHVGFEPGSVPAAMRLALYRSFVPYIVHSFCLLPHMNLSVLYITKINLSPAAPPPK